MCENEITLENFCVDILSNSEYFVDVNSLFNICGASPIHIQYKTDKIIVVDIYPEQVVLKSGESLISISQIQKIIKIVTDRGKIAYKIFCGRLESLKMVVKITQI